MSYTITLIPTEEKERLAGGYLPKIRYEIKSEIYGCCIKLLSDDHTLRDTWQENFYPMSRMCDRMAGCMFFPIHPTRPTPCFSIRIPRPPSC